MDEIHSVAYAEGVLREAIHLFKYKGARVLGESFSQMLYAYWQMQSFVVDVLVPVPLHSRRHRERGYNQSAILAEQLGRLAGVSCDTATLQRIRYTQPQVGLDAQRRRENVAGAFACADDSFAGKRVLLIDDVFTTGSTLRACGEALKASGARSVSALTLARASDLVQGF